MTTPKRIQRQRTRGWRMPEDAIYVGRPSKFGNPFAARIPHGESLQARETRALLVEQYRLWLVEGVRSEWIVERLPLSVAATRRPFIASTPVMNRPSLREVRAELSGHDLLCWCPLGQPCHADLLLEVANS